MRHLFTVQLIFTFGDICVKCGIGYYPKIPYFRIRILALFCIHFLYLFYIIPYFFMLSRDNPGHPEDSKMEKTELVVNVLQAANLVVLGKTKTKKYTNTLKKKKNLL